MARGALGIVQKHFPKVTKVTDATENIKIEVTKKDNEHAKVRDHTACSMAVACKRTFKLDGVIVAVSTAYLIKGDSAMRFTLPQSVSREIVSFDRKAGFDEGIYQLSKINPANRLGERANRKPGDKKNRADGDGTKMFRHVTNGIRALGGKDAPDGVRNTHA